jgi:hypothetical protein
VPVHIRILGQHLSWFLLFNRIISIDLQEIQCTAGLKSLWSKVQRGPLQQLSLMMAIMQLNLFFGFDAVVANSCCLQGQTEKIW